MPFTKGKFTVCKWIWHLQNGKFLSYILEGIYEWGNYTFTSCQSVLTCIVRGILSNWLAWGWIHWVVSCNWGSFLPESGANWLLPLEFQNDCQLWLPSVMGERLIPKQCYLLTSWVIRSNTILRKWRVRMMLRLCAKTGDPWCLQFNTVIRNWKKYVLASKLRTWANQ